MSKYCLVFCKMFAELIEFCFFPLLNSLEGYIRLIKDFVSEKIGMKEVAQMLVFRLDQD